MTLMSNTCCPDMSLVLHGDLLIFYHLATARSEKEQKEVGVRKAIGSGKKELVFQFLMSLPC